MKKLRITLLIVMVFAASIAIAFAVNSSKVGEYLALDAYAQAQQPTKQAHADLVAPLSDKAKLEIREEQLTLTQIQMQLNALVQQYQDAMRKDDRYKKLDEATKDHSAKIQSLLEASKKELKVPDGMEFDFSSLSWVKPQPSPTPKAN